MEMDSKIDTCYLMTSRRINLALRELAAGQEISNDRQMAVVAGLKLLRQDYVGVGLEKLCADLASASDLELSQTARQIHPLLCSLKLEKWLGGSGECHYLVESIAYRGGANRRILLDSHGREMRADEWQVAGGQASL